MVDLKQLGWDAETVGELDHRLLRAPHVKLRSANVGSRGDVVYCVDLRISQPNVEFLSSTEMHSLEHFLLYGFVKYMTANFLSVGLMGCQTGFYLVLYNEGNAETICSTYEAVLNDVLVASEVPYANVQQCGNAKNHSVELAQAVAKKVLDARANWRRVV
ncbi:S-ribosylhomocysteine lyase [Mycobacterium riyadhense]|uniref:S-ribosylhomocysteine lyase n=1 Tax=Mycobacterium riyadhense TaxID=486698 RepID=A0A1X2B8N4_9MYCO|nr:S-ribosylhomocysteine lyase [Mycobacterium riyadhense]MCV7145864.1 S-ribosylhomocysteine lyase [Mycobacterium riyadhense]ORW59639.1 serine protease [Mycobacterium riyadhense]VTO97730.1 S-ribosylhomocysteine lyase [Mycobacterium riyadhense]